MILTYLSRPEYVDGVQWTGDNRAEIEYLVRDRAVVTSDSSDVDQLIVITQQLKCDHPSGQSFMEDVAKISVRLGDWIMIRYGAEHNVVRVMSNDDFMSNFTPFK